MKLKTLALLGAAGWAYSKGPRDLAQWPAFLGEEFARIRGHALEAVDAAKQASSRRQDEIDRELAEAMGRESTPRT